MIEYLYKGNKIVGYPDGTFIAYYYAKDDNSEDIQEFYADTLERAQRAIDQYTK